MENNYTALYRKYRPRTFDDVVGQDIVVKTLKNSIINNKIAHAYLFAGPRGTGKTSVAKILAAAVNCSSKSKEVIPCMQCDNCISIRDGINPDIIEMDAASNRGIDDIRSIIDKVKYRPLQSEYKVYIIDEVHMLTKDSFNALLKTLEEPPEHTIFILATTEPLKILPTIISRCQRYDFSRVESQNIVDRLKYVIEAEISGGRKIDYEESALSLIADLSKGGMRDALSILDQCLAYNNDSVFEENVNAIYGITTKSNKLNLIKKVYNKDVEYLIKKIREYNDSGIDFKTLTEDLINIYKEAFIFTTCNKKSLISILDETEVNEICDMYSAEELMQSIDLLMDVMNKFEATKNVADYFEVAMLKVMAVKNTIVAKRNVTEQKNDQFKSVKKEFNNSIDKIEKEEPKVLEEVMEPEDALETEDNTDHIDVQDELIESDEDEGLEEIIPQSFTYSMDFYLSILVSANKDERNSDNRIINDKKNNNFAVSKMKFSSLLNEMNIIASARDVLLVEVSHESVANQINEGDFNKGIYEYFREDLGIDKMIYAINSKVRSELINEFKIRRDNNSLPKPAIITKYNIKKNQEEEISLEEKLINLFGADNVKIKEN